MKRVGSNIGKEEGFSYFLGHFTKDIEGEKVLKEMVAAYGARWKIKEFHRQIKVNFNLESISLQRYEALRNMVSIIFVIASFLVSAEFKELIMEIIKDKMSWRKMRKYLNEQWRYIYYWIFEELSHIFQNIRFTRRITFQIPDEKYKMQNLFSLSGVEQWYLLDPTKSDLVPAFSFCSVKRFICHPENLMKRLGFNLTM